MLTTVRDSRRLVLPVLALLSCSIGCASAPPFDAAAMVQEWAAFMQRDYVLRPGDSINVTAYGNPQFEVLAQQVIVSPNGTVSLIRLPRELRAEGLSISGFRQVVQQAYSEVFINIEINVNLVEAALSTVYVAGEVQDPGPVPYVPGMTLSQVIAYTGGLAITAKDSDVRVLRNNSPGLPYTYRVNVSEILYQEGLDFLVLPGDVVFCQTSAIADAGIFIQLWIRNLLPFNIGGAAFF